MICSQECLPFLMAICLCNSWSSLVNNSKPSLHTLCQGRRHTGLSLCSRFCEHWSVSIMHSTEGFFNQTWSTVTVWDGPAEGWINLHSFRWLLLACWLLKLVPQDTIRICKWWCNWSKYWWNTQNVVPCLWLGENLVEAPDSLKAAPVYSLPVFTERTFGTDVPSLLWWAVCAE